MSLSIHRRTGHGRALLLSTVCNTGREQREVKSASASAGIPRSFFFFFSTLMSPTTGVNTVLEKSSGACIHMQTK